MIAAAETSSDTTLTAQIAELQAFLLARFREECAFLARTGQAVSGAEWGRITSYVGNVAEWPTFADGEPCADCIRETMSAYGLPVVLRALAAVMEANRR